MCVCVCGYKHVSAQAFYEHAIALLTPEILTLQPDRAATGRRVLVVVVGDSHPRWFLPPDMGNQGGHSGRHVQLGGPVPQEANYLGGLLF